MDPRPCGWKLPALYHNWFAAGLSSELRWVQSFAASQISILTMARNGESRKYRLLQDTSSDPICMVNHPGQSTWKQSTKMATNTWAQCIGMFMLPETPRFLVKKGKHDAARKSLVFLRRLPAEHPALEGELAEIQANYNYEVSLGSASYLECFKGTIGKRTFTGITLQSLQV